MDEEYDLIVVDTPTSVEDHRAAMKRLILSSDFVLVPTGQHWDDIQSVVPWMRYVRECGARAAFLLNKCKPRTKAFKEARVELLKAGPLCPMEIPDREDIPTLAKAGLTVIDVNGTKSSDEVVGVWLHLKNEMGL
jgi:chromosome partitioning protein